jgi:acetyltransferase-like isoleucine patch superfamily enzyme
MMATNQAATRRQSAKTSRQALLSTGGDAGRLTRLLLIRLINYLTNYSVNRVPSFAFRRMWYMRVLGVVLEKQAGVHLGCYLWHYTPREVRRHGARVGKYSRINRDCTIDLRGGIDIGASVSVSPEVVILTAAHAFDKSGFPVEHRRVVIEDYVWIGTRAMIMPGVTLGRGCVVAAGAVVTKSVPPLAVVAGVPAREVGRRPEDALGYVFDWSLPLFE